LGPEHFAAAQRTIASTHEGAHAGPVRAQYAKISSWYGKLRVKPRKRLWKARQGTFETIPSPNRKENINSL